MLQVIRPDPAQYIHYVLSSCLMSGSNTHTPEPSGKKKKIMSPLPLRHPPVKGQQINWEIENITCATRVTNRQKNELGLISRTSHQCVGSDRNIGHMGPWWKWICTLILMEGIYTHSGPEGNNQTCADAFTPCAVFILCDKNNLSCSRLKYFRCLFRHKQSTENWSKRLR